MPRYVRYVEHGIEHTGLVFHGRVQDLPGDPDILQLLQGPADKRNETLVRAGRQQRREIAQTRLLPPIQPRAMRDFVAFEAHIAGMKKSEPGDGTVPEQWYEAPAFLFMNPWSVVASGDDIPMPPLTQ